MQNFKPIPTLIFNLAMAEKPGNDVDVTFLSVVLSIANRLASKIAFLNPKTKLDDKGMLRIESKSHIFFLLELDLTSGQI